MTLFWASFGHLLIYHWVGSWIGTLMGNEKPKKKRIKKIKRKTTSKCRQEPSRQLALISLLLCLSNFFSLQFDWYYCISKNCCYIFRPEIRLQIAARCISKERVKFEGELMEGKVPSSRSMDEWVLPLRSATNYKWSALFRFPKMLPCRTGRRIKVAEPQE